MLTTVLTQQCPYGAYAQLEKWRLLGATPLPLPVHLAGRESGAKVQRTTKAKHSRPLPAFKNAQGDGIVQIACTSVTSVDLFVRKSLSCELPELLVLNTARTHGPRIKSVFWREGLGLLHYSELNYRQECAHTHTCHCLDREGAPRRWVVVGVVGEASHMTHYCFILCQPEYISRRRIMTQKNQQQYERKTNCSTKCDWPADPTRFFPPVR